MTLDRDIRFTTLEIAVTQRALRDEIRRRTRSIEKAEAARRAGQKVQQNVLQSHYTERAAAKSALDNLEVARRAIGSRIAASL